MVMTKEEPRRRDSASWTRLRGRAKPAKKKKTKAKKSTSKPRTSKGRHSKKNPSWITPPETVAIIRASLGNVIELDPFSSEIANRTVDADRFYTKKDDGFLQAWICETMSINPPGLMVVRAWQKLVHEYLEGRTKQAVWVGFSVEQFCVLANEELHPLSFSYVILRKRISFVTEKGKRGSPSHGNYICALGMDHAVFEKHFGHLGRVGHGVMAVNAAPQKVPPPWIRGLVRCAELNERDHGGKTWDDESRQALDDARALGWGRHRIGTLGMVDA